jgi:hypothetical protein
VNGLERVMAKACHGRIGEAWTGFGHVSGCDLQRRTRYVSQQCSPVMMQHTQQSRAEGSAARYGKRGE